jgi:hypothetical protein
MMGVVYHIPRHVCRVEGCTNTFERTAPNQRYCLDCRAKQERERWQESYTRRHPAKTILCDCGVSFSPKGRQTRCDDCRFAPSANPLRKLQERDIPVIRARYQAGDTAGKIARDYGMARSTIYAIVDWQTWRHVS